MTARIFVAMPSGKSLLDVDSSVSLHKNLRDLTDHGIEYETLHIHGNCYIALVRSLYLHEFRKSGCTHLLYWDDDVSVAGPQTAVRRLILQDRDIIVAPYPKKVAPGAPPTKKWPYAIGGSGIPDANGLVESDMVATGFLLIKRHVIETMWDKYGAPDLGEDGRFDAWLAEFDRIRAENPQGLAAWMVGEGRPPIRSARIFHHREGNCDIVDLFPTGILDDFPKNAIGKNMWWGEDYSFSLLAKALGFKIWLDPWILLLHSGRNVWAGNFLAEASDKPKKATEAAE